MNFNFGIEKKIGAGIHPTIAQGPDGTLHITYVNGGSIIYRTYNPATGAVGSELVVYSGEVWGPQIAVGPDNEPHIVFENNVTGPTGYIGYLRRVSGVWKSVGNLYTQGYRAMMPRIAVDNNSRAHIVFWKNTGSSLDATYARGQYIRISKSGSSIVIEKSVDIFGWDGSRTGCVVMSSNVPHIFNASPSQINHWTVSESGVLTASTPLPKPAGTTIEKFMEYTSVSTGAGGGFYAFSKDAGDPATPKEVFHTRIGGSGSFTIIVWDQPLVGLSVSTVGDTAKSGLAYAIFAGTDKRGRILAVDQDGSIYGPELFADVGNQHDGNIRHGPHAAAATGGGVYIAYQDNRSGAWNVYVTFASLLPPEPVVGVPKQTDWQDAGEVLHAGPEGSWDVRFGGALSPCAVIKKDGTFFLYYIGADGDMVGDPESTTDPGPRHRSVGVATSSDGIHFTKYANNPILRHLPTNGQEEGTFSLGAMVDENNNVLIYYSTMEVTAPLNVNSDVSLAVSSNGLNFVHVKDVLKSNNPVVWGYGDELFPVGALKTEGKYYVWYIAKGVNAMWDVGLASGTDRATMTSTKPLIAYGSGTPNDIVGGGMPVILGDKIILFFERGRNPSYMEIFWSPLNNPSMINGPVEIYPNIRIHSTVFRDPDNGAWYMYHADGRYAIRAQVFNLPEPPPQPILQTLSLNPTAATINKNNILPVTIRAINSNNQAVSGVPLTISFESVDGRGSVEIIDPEVITNEIDGTAIITIKALEWGMVRIIVSSQEGIIGEMILTIKEFSITYSNLQVIAAEVGVIAAALYIINKEINQNGSKKTYN